MNDHERRFERAARAWLETGPTIAPARTVEAALLAIDTTPQERGLIVPRRIRQMPIPARLAAAAAILLLVAGGSLYLFRPASNGIGGPTSAPSLTATPTATRSPTPSPSSTTIGSADVGKILASGRYEIDWSPAPFLVTLPAGWTVTEFAATSLSVADAKDGKVNAFLAIVDKVYPDPCHTAGGPRTVGPSVEQLVAALSSTPGFHVARAADVVVGGAPGTTLTLGNDINVGTAGCSGDMLPFLTHAQDGRDIDVAMFGGETDRLWIVTTRTTRVLIAVTENYLTALQPVIDSIRFVDARVP